MAALLLKVNELFCERDERILFENLNFDLHAGKILHVKGKNGSGKTSLLRILCGLYQENEGQIDFLEENVQEVRDLYNQSLLFIGHHVSVKQALTPRENLNWYAKIHPQLDASLIESALSSVGLQNYEDVLCQNLSAGQKRRVNLARLFMFAKERFTNSLWILDEPFTAIDVDGVEKLERRILYYIENGGSVILTTHQPLQIGAVVEQLNLDDWGT